MGYQLVPKTNYLPPKIISMISTIQDVPLYKNEDFLREKYGREGLSIAEISRQISSTRSSVTSSLKELRIEPEPLTKKSFKRQLAYGERMIKGRIIVHKGEQKIIRSILSLREEGKSYEAIAKWLSDEGIKTKNGLPSWDRSTVSRVLKRNWISG